MLMEIYGLWINKFYGIPMFMKMCGLIDLTEFSCLWIM